ncbi:hypothetical protein [Sphingobacterium sp. MYb388]
MKKLALLAFMLTMTTVVFGQDFTENAKIVTTSGIGLGSVIDIMAS